LTDPYLNHPSGPFSLAAARDAERDRKSRRVSAGVRLAALRVALSACEIADTDYLSWDERDKLREIGDGLFTLRHALPEMVGPGAYALSHGALFDPPGALRALALDLRDALRAGAFPDALPEGGL